MTELESLRLLLRAAVKNGEIEIGKILTREIFRLMGVECERA